MPEQFELNFSKPELTPEEELKRLAKEYQEKVGIDPLVRTFDRETILAGITDPEAEKDRIRKIDQEDDKLEMRKTYTR